MKVFFHGWFGGFIEKTNPGLNYEFFINLFIEFTMIHVRSEHLKIVKSYVNICLFIQVIML